MTETRTFTFDDAQSKYLAKHFALPAEVSRMVSSTGRSQITLTRAQRDTIVEQVGDRLQRRGFDPDWNPTDEGEMLESIIDVLTNTQNS